METVSRTITSFANPWLSMGRHRSFMWKGELKAPITCGTSSKAKALKSSLPPPEKSPLLLEDLDAYEAVILSDVEADTMTPVEMEALAIYVRELGGGFILVGGESVYGEEGYSETVVEEILPVSFDLERPSVALIIVLDKSGSMGGEKLELAKEASKAAVEVLRNDHMIGIVAFDYDHYCPWICRRQRIAKKSIEGSAESSPAVRPISIQPLRKLR